MTLRGGHLNPSEQEKASSVGHTRKVIRGPHDVVLRKTHAVQPGSPALGHQLKQTETATLRERMRMRMEINQHMEYHPLRGEKRRRDSATSLNVYICNAALQARKTGRTKCWRGNDGENNAKTSKNGFARLWLPLSC